MDISVSDSWEAVDSTKDIQPCLTGNTFYFEGVELNKIGADTYCWIKFKSTSSFTASSLRVLSNSRNLEVYKIESTNKPVQQYVATVKGSLASLDVDGKQQSIPGLFELAFDDSISCQELHFKFLSIKAPAGSSKVRFSMNRLQIQLSGTAFDLLTCSEGVKSLSSTGGTETTAGAHGATIASTPCGGGSGDSYSSEDDAAAASLTAMMQTKMNGAQVSQATAPRSNSGDNNRNNNNNNMNKNSSSNNNSNSNSASSNGGGNRPGLGVSGSMAGGIGGVSSVGGGMGMGMGMGMMDMILGAKMAMTIEMGKLLDEKLAPIVRRLDSIDRQLKEVERSQQEVIIGLQQQQQQRPQRTDQASCISSTASPAATEIVEVVTTAAAATAAAVFEDQQSD